MVRRINRVIESITDMRKRAFRLVFCGLVALAAVLPGRAQASPWVEVGDAGLRRDIEILAAYRLIDGLVTTWPIPWAQVARAINDTEPRDYPTYVRQALNRVARHFRAETETRRLRIGARAQVTNEPPLVRDFGHSVYDELEGQVWGEYLWDTTAARLNVGYLGRANLDDARLTLDRSYVAQELGNWLLYAGWLERWWGPGNISSLILSNNARPVPHVGLMRNNPTAFESSWLSWIGPWQLNIFAGLLDDDREAHNALFTGGRLTVNPIEGLELGINANWQMCGEGHPCDGRTFANAFLFKDTISGENRSNLLAGGDARYTVPIDPVILSVYGQYLGEDQRSDVPNKAGWVVGATLTGHAAPLGATWQLIFEGSDSSAALYNNSANGPFNVFYSSAWGGYRYQDRAIGHSLDNDARLYSVKATLTDAADRSLYVAYHLARLNRDGVGAGNTVSDSAETVNLGQLGFMIPWRRSVFSVDLTIQDNRPDSPEEDRFLFSALAGVNTRF